MISAANLILSAKHISDAVNRRPENNLDPGATENGWTGTSLARGLM